MTNGEWPKVKTGALAEQVRGVSYGKEDASATPLPGYLPVLRAGNITDDGLFYDDLVFVPKERVSEKQKIRRHDVVIAASSGSLDVVGKAAPALADFDGSFGAFCKVLRPNAKVHPSYFAHFFKTLDYRRRVSALAAGANINNLRNEHLDDMEIPLPPLVEQRRIAEVLDRAEALRAKRRAALAQLDSLTQSLFLDRFGDPISNPRKWPQENLETFFHFRTGKLDSNASVASGQYPFFTCSRDDFRIDTFAFDCEALLLAGNNASADYSVKHFKGKFNAYQRTYVITLRDERNSYDYSRFVLEHRLGELKRMSKGTGTKYLTMELLNRIRVPVPPISLQREFARRVTAVEALKTAQRASLAELDALFATLQHRAFRGEL
ncbi:MAG: restriction endonuclease subunit S [Chloroflexi bacterium]|nr:restriction endonuclease subunit S [Chloroflexota bacterium]